jgi:predicted lipid-binding transport protein (Tim44 family)
MRRSSAVLTALLVAGLAFAPSFADARAGSGSSMGSRGTRTYSAPPSTSTAPSYTAPMQRSMTPQSSPSVPGTTPYGAPQRSGFGSGLMGGLAGGLLGVGLGSLLMGHGLFGGGGMGGFGFIGLLLQLALLFFVGRWLLRMFMGRSPAMAGMARMGQPAPMLGAPMPGGGGPAAAPPVAIGPADFQAFDKTLHDVQAAWSAQDMRALQQMATPEMVSYFGEQLAEQASRGVRNTVTDVKLEQGDLSEAWAEGGREYATVAMRFSMLDVTRDSTGRVVEGDLAQRSMATELWTFLRAPGGRWLLSAIQQAR